MLDPGSWDYNIPRTPDNAAAIDRLPPDLSEYPGWLPGEEQILNQWQIVICTLRYNKIPYKLIQEIAGISSPNTIATVIRLTATSRTWKPGQIGGSYSIISDYIIKRLKDNVQIRRRGLNCMKTFEARNLLYTELSEAKKLGLYRLSDWHSNKLSRALTEEYIDCWPTSSMLDTACTKAGIFIMSGEKLELLRRKCCNQPAIDRYFNLLQYAIMGIQPEYKYNADETGLSSGRTWKILTDKKMYNMTLDDIKSQHISCMCCYSATGDKVKPFFILTHHERKLPELEGLDDIYLACSDNGWMTLALWDIWVIAFVSHISIKRSARVLDPNLKVFLFVDGHPSRLSPLGMRLLVRFNIVCIVLPSHSTHILQPFDISIASPLKLDYQKELSKPDVTDEVNKIAGLNQAQSVRRRRVIAFSNAWAKRTPTDLRKSFTDAGLEPLNKDALANRRFIPDPLATQRENDIVANARTCPLSGTIATEHLDQLDPLIWRHFHENRLIQDNIEPDQITPEMIAIRWSSGTSRAGKIFSPLPVIMVDGADIMHEFRV